MLTRGCASFYTNRDGISESGCDFGFQANSLTLAAAANVELRVETRFGTFNGA